MACVCRCIEPVEHFDGFATHVAVIVLQDALQGRYGFLGVLADAEQRQGGIATHFGVLVLQGCGEGRHRLRPLLTRHAEGLGRLLLDDQGVVLECRD